MIPGSSKFLKWRYVFFSTCNHIALMFSFVRCVLFARLRGLELASWKLVVKYWLLISWHYGHQQGKILFLSKDVAKLVKPTNTSALLLVFLALTPNLWFVPREGNSNVHEVVAHLVVTKSKIRFPLQRGCCIGLHQINTIFVTKINCWVWTFLLTSMLYSMMQERLHATRFSGNMRRKTGNRVCSALNI